MIRTPVVLLAFVLALAPSVEAQLPADTSRPRDSVPLAEIRVIGTADALARIPGSAEVIAGPSLRLWHAQTTSETLRRVAGLTLRDEEGLGLRPNIGIRGLNPSRSTKVLLLEDGVPLALAPYGDNSTYYHPSLDRFARIEVLKGSGQILFGPQTVGGVINYITPAIPVRPSGALSLEAGSGGALSGMATGGGTLGRVGLLASFEHKNADGSRDNIATTLNDVMIKGNVDLGAGQRITIRANGYRERSNVTYSGLTETEWAADPRANPFENDSMFLDRGALSLTHQLDASRRLSFTTTAYLNTVRRHWWRQSSNSAERPNDAADPACAGMANLNTTCGNQGRLRSYRVAGIEPRARAAYGIGTGFGVLDAGVRLHLERQDRRQLNGATPDARTSTTVAEDNHRTLTAWSMFAQNRFAKGRWSVTPGIRFEHIDYHRVNRLPDPDVAGRTSLSQLVPGIGATHESGAITVFAGVHRGFAPPRTEDVIDNATGDAIELDAELSWNSELGIRGRAGALNFQATLFRMDFENQIVAASVAGGTGAALTNAGRTMQQGLEVSGRVDVRRGWYLQTAFTWLPVARFEGERYVYVGTGGNDVTGKVYAAQNAGGTRTRTSVTGKRLPYAPEASLTASIGHSRGPLDARLEAVIAGGQFGDALNTSVIVADGQQGPVASFVIWNAAVTWQLPRLNTSIYLSAQNLFDRLYIADRTRGIVPGTQRRIQAGLRQEF